ncbi:MAG: TM0106 family RecB-like putative nuclease [Candidatus Obscuribacterales bacterium]
MRRNEETRQLIFSPSDLIKFMGSPFDSWMDRYYLEHPDQVKPDPDPADRQLTARKGIDHEHEFLETLKLEGRSVYEVKDRTPEGRRVSDAERIADTKRAIDAGYDVIYQGALFLGEFGGYSDFLVRVEKPSPALGEFQYEVWDTKLANHAKPYFLIQLLCYSEILADVQGVFPEMVQVVLGSKKRVAFRSANFLYLYRQLKARFLQFQYSFADDDAMRPEPNGLEQYGRWASLAQAWLDEVDHLSQVAGIRQSQIAKLQAAGIQTFSQLAVTDLHHVPDLNPSTFAALRAQAAIQARTLQAGKTQYEVLPPVADAPRSGLALLPPASPLDVCFDMEGFPYFEGGLEYLFGVTFEQDGKLEFKDWWAHTNPQEKIAFEDFVDWVFDRWQRDPDMHIYHYGHYEVTRLRKLMGKYGSREIQIDALLRGHVFVDLYKLVKNSVRIGEPSYSIKYVEHLYKDARSGAVATASESVVQYQNWLDTRDGDTWETSAILGGIRAYNEEDCISTWELAEWLRTVQRGEAVRYIPHTPPAPPEEDENSESGPSASSQSRARAAKLAEELLAVATTERSEERKRLLELFAWLLEFHWREARPVFWAMYARHEMSEEELFDDIDCLAGLERTETSPARPHRGRSCIYEYKFDPDQDTKLKKGDPCFFSHDLRATCEIAHIDCDRGLVWLRIGNRLEAPPQLSIIPNQYVPATPIADSIYRTVLKWLERDTLPQAIADFIDRQPPRLHGNGLSAVEHGGAAVDVADVISRMDNTSLCIQGPPGAGKTYQAARAIVELIRTGKKVGISSNGHKAVSHLMSKVAEVAEDLGVHFCGVKIKKDEDGLLDRFRSITSAPSGRDVFDRAELDYQLVGGSAWAFVLECARGKLDYLFVDEAGQVALANLVGMAPCARNIVLMGDQMQLGQPTQGTHPGDSGKSTLEYFLQDHATIPSDLGIFLGTTHRMHPRLCQFISDAVYEGRLAADEKTEKRVLVLPERSRRFISRQSGILYIPVEHEGNTQGSPEEAECIKQVVDELLMCRRLDEHSTEALALRLDDILIVAPYNMQVRKIKQLLPAANVGSVDKFQGQERPIVIISMCTSDGDSSPRGLEFLLNRNRLNVAVSRAQTLAIVVGSPQLTLARCSSVEQMELVNLYCRIVQEGAGGSLDAVPRIGAGVI